MRSELLTLRTSEMASERLGRSLRPSNHGFTLVELLVVVAILALLISILLPALSGAREVARQSVCLSAQRQIGVGLVSYTTEHRGIVPFGTQNNSNPRPADFVPAWYELFRTEMDFTSDRAFLCPSANDGDRVFRPSGPGAWTWVYQTSPSSPEKWWGINYGANSNIMPRNDKWQQNDQSNIHSLKHTSEVFAVSETVGEYLGGWYPGNQVTFRHGTANDRINLCFWDGHVENWSEQASYGKLIDITSYHYTLPWNDPE